MNLRIVVMYENQYNWANFEHFGWQQKLLYNSKLKFVIVTPQVVGFWTYFLQIQLNLKIVISINL